MKASFYHTLSAVLLFSTALTCADEASAYTDNMTVHATAYENSGAMLGGFGTGFLELRPDGCFQDWAIFSRGRWAFRDFAADRDNRMMPADLNGDSLQFFIRTGSKDTEPQVRRLGLNGGQTRVYNGFPWLHNVDAINYTATYPGATLDYVDDTLPVKVTGNFYSCVIPHELKISGTPGIFMEFTIKNTSGKEQEVALATYLRNPLARRATRRDTAEERMLVNTVSKENGFTCLTMETKAGAPYVSSLGSLTLSTTGDETSWIACDFRKYLLGEIVNPAGWGNRYHSPLLDIRNTARLPKADQQPYPGNLVPNKAAVEKFVNGLSSAQVDELISKVRAVPSLNSFYKTIQTTGAPRSAALEGTEIGVAEARKLSETQNEKLLLKVMPGILDRYAEDNRAGTEWGDGMLCSTVKIAPGEEKKIRMVLAWYFPNHANDKGDKIQGHMYSNWFKDSKEVNGFLTAEYGNLTSRIQNFIGLMQNNNLPPVLKFASSAQLYTMTAMTWWTQNDKMGIWEGHGAIGMNTMDVMYSATHPFAALFPGFQQNFIRNVNQWRDKQSGRLYHSLADMDFGGYGHGWGYVDVNSSFVMQSVRDYLWTGDAEFLKSIWPGFVASMNVFRMMDSDNDGLPDQNAGKNWYDTFEMRGTPGCMTGVWISMLRGGIRLAEDIGDTEHAREWKKLLPQVLENYEKKMYNGEYYSVWVDGNERDDACMSDQLSGEFYARLIGLGNGLPVERVRQIQQTIYKYNYSPETGLLNGTYPAGRKPYLPIYQNIQLDGVWSGFEYAYAASLIDQGFVDMGLNVIKAVDFRYERGGRRWNHHECGDHYSRPLSIWAAVLAATGFKVDAPQSMLTIAPPIKDVPLTAPWISATGVGSYTRTGSSFAMNCTDGVMEFKTLRVNVPVKQASFDGKPVQCTVSQQDGLTAVTFAQPLKLTRGSSLKLN